MSETTGRAPWSAPVLEELPMSATAGKNGGNEPQGGHNGNGNGSLAS